MVGDWGVTNAPVMELPSSFLNTEATIISGVIDLKHSIRERQQASEPAIEQGEHAMSETNESQTSCLHGMKPHVGEVPPQIVMTGMPVNEAMC